MNASSIFNACSKQDYIEFLTLANKLGANIDIDKFVADYYSKDMKMYKSLYERWEQSIANKTPDFSVYSDDIYMTEVYNCWKTCAKRYVTCLKRFVLENKEQFHNIKTVLDLGCGNAYSTVALSVIFNDATIIGTNLSGTLQYAIDDYVCDLNDRCYMVDESRTLDLESVDLIFASEFFEHLIEPIDLLENLLIIYNPEYMVFKNNFTHMSLGHFLTYNYNGKVYDRMDMNKLFYNTLKAFGYTKVKTGFFADAPMIYKKSTVQQKLF